MRTSHKLLEMALIKTSALITDISGKIAGSVFQRSKSGLIMRASPAPVNPSLPSQSQNRINAATIQQAWQALSISDRNLWEVYAVFKNKSTRKNALTKLTGQSIFMQENAIRIIHTQHFGVFSPVILTAPVITAAPQNVNIAGITVGGSGMVFSMGYDIPDDSQFFVFYLSRPLLPSQVSSYNKKKVFAYVSSTGGSQSMGSIYTAAFGALPAVGQYLNTEVALYDKSINTFGLFTVQRHEIFAE